MSEPVEFALRTVLIGGGATVTMDLWTALLRRFGVRSLNFALLGRWVAHLFRGRWRHASIETTTPVRGELWIGWFAHYSIGVAFSAVLLWTFGLDWGRAPTLAPALFVGIVTVAAPWFILQPGMGAGIASSKTPRPAFNAVKSLVSHTVFGAGLYLGAVVTALVVPSGK